MNQALSDDVLGQAIVLKPNSPGSTHRLQTSLLSLLPVIKAPVNVKLDWMSHITPVSHFTCRCYLFPLTRVFTVVKAEKDMRGVRFVQIARKVYALANSSSSLHLVSTNLLRALFVNLRDETLLLLAGMWSNPNPNDVEKGWEGIRLAALHHGTAFLRAQSLDTPRDFQAILPSLLVALQSEDRRVRFAAIACVRSLASTASVAQRPIIYAQDDVYGKASDKVQLLDWADFTRYVKVVDKHGDHFATDSSYVSVFHQTELRRQKSDSKKDAG